MRLQKYLLASFTLIILSFVSLAPAAPLLNYNVGSRGTSQMRTVPDIETQGGTQFIRIGSKAGNKELLGKWKDSTNGLIIEFLDDGTFSIPQGTGPWKSTGKNEIELGGNPFQFTILGDKLKLSIPGNDSPPEIYRRLTKKEERLIRSEELVKKELLGKWKGTGGNLEFFSDGTYMGHDGKKFRWEITGKGKAQLGPIPIQYTIVKGKLNVMPFGDTSSTQIYRRFTQEELSTVLDGNLLTAISQRQVDIIKKLLEEGADANAKYKATRSRPVRSPLLEAIDVKNIDIVKILLTYGAEVNTKDKSMAPLLHAIKLNLVDIVKQLIDHGADVNVNSKGITVLHLSGHFGHTEIIEVLLEHGADVDGKIVNADVDEKNINEDSPLFLATRQNNLDSVRALLKHGADVNAKPGKKRLMEVASPEVKELLSNVKN